ncbi:MAG TPA: hypothetical protein K8V05_06640 [Butyricimonas virosa]|uniref:Uncharacterized protein n=1 Tax=Butyricimonas virosa TaxID=544645 RepID=A0A921KY50_9BACT|nr:hypothetical protein [Butyricimonas virosa]
MESLPEWKAPSKRMFSRLKMARILSSESTSVSACALSIHCSGSDRKA